MSEKVSQEDLSVLRNIRQTESPGDFHCQATLTRLFNFGFATRQRCGSVVITNAGERYLFQKECCATLWSIGAHEEALSNSDVSNWLFVAGFIEEVALPDRIRVSRSGKIWLESFAVSVPGQKLGARKSAHFARQRFDSKEDMRFAR
jgi:hypothetical protein